MDAKEEDPWDVSQTFGNSKGFKIARLLSESKLLSLSETMGKLADYHNKKTSLFGVRALDRLALSE